MSTPIIKNSQKQFLGGISDYLKQSFLDRQFPNASFVFARSINYRNDPNSITLLPGALKESGSVITDLIKWGETVPTLTKYFFYGDSGNLYQRTSTPTWSKLGQLPSSHGNGLGYFTGDDYLYATTDTTISRYGPVSGTPQLSSDFLRAQGGIPLNTNSMSFVAASSQYATAADSASLSVTGDLTLEAYFKATTLPSVGNSMTLVAKWDESTNHRSYNLNIYAISGYFGDGSDGALTISADTTDSVTQKLYDSACTGTSGTQTLTATNASFTQGQVIKIHQTQGTNAGQWERNTIQGYSAGTITLGTPLIGTYVSGAQVRNVPQWSALTIDITKTYTAKAWNGTVGGILDYLCSGAAAVNGTISANSCGFRGATSGGIATDGTYAGQGEGTAGAANTLTYTANGNGGGGGGGRTAGGGGSLSGGGAGGGHSAAGSSGSDGDTGSGGGYGGSGGVSSGTIDLTTMTLGGGGGAGGANVNSGIAAADGRTGGTGGGIVSITATTITMGASATITANGSDGGNATPANVASGGGGAGGAILLKAQTATLGTNQITASKGAGGHSLASPGTQGVNGGDGADGRIHLDYLTSYTGTTAPTLNATQDTTLVTSVTYQARLGISNDGTSFEYLSQNLVNISTGTWNRLSVSWVSSTSIATFYLNALSLGTFTGTKTSINDNASLLYLAANKTSVVANFFNGLVDDVRIWGNAQTATQIMVNNQAQLTGSEGGLKAYYKLNAAATDGTGNANNLTLVNTPTYSTDVPFPAPTTRLDIDQSFTTTGQTYTLGTTVSEAGSDTLTFTPATDPQKSVDFNISAKGTGDWTVTVHDQQNVVVATQTITNANLASAGYQEFVFTTPWRIVVGKTYHMHLTSTVADGVVVTSVASNFSNADFHTYFQFLVTDTAYHPVIPFLNFMLIGNERYLATWDGAFYHPNAITFPPGWRVRCFAFWREYVAVGVWKGTNIYDYDFGKIYFWDGIAPTFNFSIDIGDGQVNALYGVDSDLFMIAGYRGYLSNYAGGYFYNTGNSKSNKLKRIPNNRDFLETDYAEVLPGALRMWRSLLHIGMAGNSNSTTIQKGVYSWGTYNQNYPDTLSYDYPISTGNRADTVTIGCIYPAGKQLIISWQDGIGFGADVIDFANPPAPSGSLELMVEDDNTIYQDGLQNQVRADHLALASGESVDVGYQANRSGSYTLSSQNTTINSTTSRLIIDSIDGRAREYQITANLYATGSTSPTLIGLSLQGQLLSEENKF